MAKSDIFTGFEEFENVQDGTQIVYGVNVLRVDAEVEAAPGFQTVADLVNHYCDVLGLPTDVVVFVDGEKYAPSDYIPATARRIELIKPAGRKGVYLEQTEKIELSEADAVSIAIVHKDTIEYIAMVLDGAMSEDLLPYAKFGENRTVLRVEGGQAYIGHPQINAIRKEMRTAATAVRRAGTLTINDVTAKYHGVLEVWLNGEKLADGRCQTLEAGDELVVILPGATKTADFGKWVAEQREAAGWEYYAAEIERENAMAERAAELADMGWARLRVEAAKSKYRAAGVKLAGPGRTAEAIQADILEVDFPELPSEDEFVKAWMEDAAPEAA